VVAARVLPDLVAHETERLAVGAAELLGDLLGDVEVQRGPVTRAQPK
jgi:hypothetical protein